MGHAAGELPDRFEPLGGAESEVELPALLFGALALGDVARDAKEHRRAALGLHERGRMGLQPAPRATQAHDLERQDAAAARDDRAMQGCERVPILREHEADEPRVAGLREVVGLEHREARRVHLEQGAVGGEDFHALRLLLDDRAEPTLARRERCLGAVLHRDVAEDEHDAGDHAVVAADRCGTVGDLVLAAIAREQRGMVRQSHDRTRVEDTADRVDGGLARDGIHDPEDLL